MEDALKSVKEFIWDIIGYLIPGFLLIIVFNLIIEPTLSIQNNFFFDWKLFQSYLIVVVSYILGYIIYSLTIFKIKFQNFFIDLLLKVTIYLSNTFFKFFVKNKLAEYLINDIKSKHSNYWKLKFINSSTYKSAKDFLKSNSLSEVDNMEFNEVRNILMSRNPEMDQKVYTFMFRSSLFDHISTISILICLLVSTQLFIDLKFIKTDLIFKVFYCLLIPTIPLLGNSKRIFYSIAQRLPISNLK
ncbi:hypothetical protein [Flavobacterium sp. LS1P3]|uniref:hypothetical protein n=1 Tax=Flavobacterium sp. LS1P3 TaxID=3401720 RepID=UPI003AAE787B